MYLQNFKVVDNFSRNSKCRLKSSKTIFFTQKRGNYHMSLREGIEKFISPIKNPSIAYLAITLFLSLSLSFSNTTDLEILQQKRQPQLLNSWHDVLKTSTLSVPATQPVSLAKCGCYTQGCLVLICWF